MYYSQISNIIRPPHLEPISGFAANDDILRLPIGVVLVSSVDNIFPIVRVDNGRSVLDFEHDVPVYRNKVELPAHFNSHRVRVVRNDITGHRLAGMLKGIFRFGHYGHQMVAAKFG